MASKKRANSDTATELPFGAGAVDTEPGKDARGASGETGAEPAKKRRPRRRRGADDEGTNHEGGGDDAPAPETNGAPRRTPQADAPAEADAPRADRPSDQGSAPSGGADGEARPESARQAKRRRWQERRRNRRGRRRGGGGGGGQGGQGAQGGQGGQAGAEQAEGEARSQGGAEGEQQQSQGHQGQQQGKGKERREIEGLFVTQKGGIGTIRLKENGYLPTKQDAYVPPGMIQRMQLHEGAIIKGRVRRGQGRHKWELIDVQTIDGDDPKNRRNVRAFKKLTSIDPDFHYAMGDISGETSLKVVDILCPIGRGQRGLIVAPPRSGKTILLQQIAKALEKGYPEVHLLVLLVDERPEEATEWKRTVEHGEVYVSTNDEMAKMHVELAESVWARCKRLVELGEDVVLLMDSITRLGRAYNNVKGDSGRTMSGGLDTRALERPKQFFGAARNTENAGSLTILGTTLIETGSRMDQVIFEEFKGTGNMELVLSRKLADRRIFPAIDIEKSGTRKDEKLHSRVRLKRVNTLRRVLTRMHWAEAMELLCSKLDDVEKIDQFLERFEVDPEA